MAGIKRTATDALWSTYVRMRDRWTCQRCDSYLTKNPHDHREHMMERLGSDKYDQLVKRKNTALKSGEKKYYLSKEFRLIIKEKIGELDE